MLNAGLINCWNETQNMKTYSGFDFKLSSHILACLVKIRHETKGYWNIMKPSARWGGKKVDWMKLLN